MSLMLDPNSRFELCDRLFLSSSINFFDRDASIQSILSETAAIVSIVVLNTLSCAVSFGLIYTLNLAMNPSMLLPELDHVGNFAMLFFASLKFSVDGSIGKSIAGVFHRLGCENNATLTAVARGVSLVSFLIPLDYTMTSLCGFQIHLIAGLMVRILSAVTMVLFLSSGPVRNAGQIEGQPIQAFLARRVKVELSKEQIDKEISAKLRANAPSPAA